MFRSIAVVSCVFCLALAGCASHQSHQTPSQQTFFAAPEPLEEVQLPEVEITASRLNVRRSPRDGAVIGSLERGQRVEAPNPAQDGWLYVQSASGLSGWVSEKYVEPIGSASQSPPAAQALGWGD